MWLYIPTVFLSAFLLFLIQPIIAKQILPWFGGSASVWTIAMVFFQLTLLAGYAYADFIQRAPRKVQAWVHVVLLALALLFLPVIADPSWKPQGTEEPTMRILGLLVATVGLPFFLVASTAPLLQSWFAKAFAEARVYRLYALSNLASMVALLAYPFAIERVLTMREQAIIWSAGFVLFALACAGTALAGLREANRDEAPAAATTSEPPPTFGRMMNWLVLAALGSILLLATTNHLTRDVASIPFLWVVPLALYLLSFVLCFEADHWYRRWLFLPIAGVLTIGCAWGLQSHSAIYNISLALPLYLLGLFFVCMVLHGELAADRPAPQYLTRFYLMVSLGGATGGLFVGLIAPHIFPDYWELGAGLTAAALAIALILQKRSVVLLGAAGGVALVAALFFGSQVKKGIEGTRVLTRNFYGTLETYDAPADSTGYPYRILIDGVIVHGVQYLDGPLRDKPVSYYGPSSGIGRLIEAKKDKPLKIAVVGHGSGTMAAFGRLGDTVTFYEINAKVFTIADQEFSYVKDSKAKVERVLGDARLSLEREEPRGYDVMVIDAFSSDSIPIHLLTKEAMADYLKHLAPDGVVAFHVTNRYLNLAPVIDRVAKEYNLASMFIEDSPAGDEGYPTEYLLVSRDPTVFQTPGLKAADSAYVEVPDVALWTDDFNNLFQILRLPYISWGVLYSSIFPSAPFSP